MSIFDRRPTGYTDSEFVTRGEHAQRLLKDEILQSIMEEAELSALINWKETEGPQVEERERAWMIVSSLEILIRELHNVVGDGAVAENRLREQQ